MARDANIATTRIYDHRKTRPEDSPTFKVTIHEDRLLFFMLSTEGHRQALCKEFFILSKKEGPPASFRLKTARSTISCTREDPKLVGAFRWPVIANVPPPVFIFGERSDHFTAI